MAAPARCRILGNRSVFGKPSARTGTAAFPQVRLMGLLDVAHIDLAQYIHELTSHLQATMISAGTATHLNVQAEPLFLDINKAIPCGLLITELVTNALKYAFPPGRDNLQPEIYIGLWADANRVQLTIADNGVGLLPDLDWQTTLNLGLRLVNLLTAQINGVLEPQRDAGTAWTITFNRPLTGE